ncbi:quinone oxidoreductase (plasmid) [Agrobacterium tumefaciens]|uniref:Quinone oxidoreductase n=2 Tax=Agrobacterium tumefaciens complex TaxID=1183400 RepID=A0A2Z2PMF6_9HYPH|nr:MULTISPECIES: quinone oxidoreductase [Agrobacterium tumefaciens complex]ASK43522.1 quinone oxidoreductase [Agrobacterium radiobacter]ASK44087.1 quinone oxidoreductase [Agrobacterium fabrum]ASK46458.1 quinone oxidoreductase [Agrobacterium fabrum]NSY04803.1 quinone oxidoreductase [Agrobacterium tumefaciens]QEG98078.1 2-haloacrylate reductase [Agrobacterium tumefaciens]
MDKKVELIATGDVDKLRVSGCPPQEPGPGELRIRHDAIGVNYIDIYQRIGLYPLPLPAVLGVEGAGVIEAIGPDVDNIHVGDRVAYTGIPGAYSATRLLPAWRTIKLPDDISTRIAALSFLRGLTAHMLLTRTYSVKQGETLLIHAAAGGLGFVLTRWAKSLGCIVIGTTGSSEKADVARANGVDHVIVGREADVVSEIGRLTKGKGVDFAIDGIGGEMLRKTLGCVRRFGTVASIGQAAGPIPPVSVEELGPIRSLSLARPSVMAYAAEQETYHLAAKAVIAAIREGIMPEPGGEYPLSEAAQAQSDLESGRTAGSLMLVP